MPASHTAPTLADLDVSAQGVLATISDRQDGVAEDLLCAFAVSAAGEEAFKEIKGHLPDLDLYFSTLAEEGSERALDLFEDREYARLIGRPIDRVEDALLVWLAERELLAPALPLGPRARLSALAERRLTLA